MIIFTFGTSNIFILLYCYLHTILMPFSCNTVFLHYDKATFTLICVLHKVQYASQSSLIPHLKYILPLQPLPNSAFF